MYNCPPVFGISIEKAWAKKLRWAGWTYSHAKGRTLYGIHIVVVLWYSTDGYWRIPVAFRLWRPKQSCSPTTYQTKNELVVQMIKEILATEVTHVVQYVVGDTASTAGWLTKYSARLGTTWHGPIMPNTKIVYRGKTMPVANLATLLRKKWRRLVGMRASRAITIYAPTYGHIRITVLCLSRGKYQYLATNDLSADVTTMLRCKQSRWPIETVFRDTKHYVGLEACHCWCDHAWVRHVALVLLTFVFMQRIRVDHTERVAHVKERCQLEVIRNGEQPPEPLRACLPDMRRTA